ncbi:hypothetical protein LTR10_013506 [Elasticomyces elasticus]|uniref:Integral membrane protein n=1 Tax=Exophiala sideris TaxID=1016849 RepID=A0ABR0JPX0_9EURO|nr:hypothetical protein LTR10_013506 [Elasticomyces elasticus]KAK5039643.1 hypothetical protein LTS07_000137 [Exophiala sideris]KAK5041195.1 hypothetical protein LTR13_002669 [Exophiala sideris]KAK5068020.1 hypothetical protein LTR69_000137 [Exophiala sideris]KAK5187322.1 hypothetical protein LTR44_000137 [Eurotiomycetes sp. CCFEE 6388]
MSSVDHVDFSALKPLLRAYALGYVTSTGPRLFSFLRSLRRQKLSTQEKLDVLYTILKTSTQPNRFPTAAAIIVGGATALARLVRAILQRVLSIYSKGSLRLSDSLPRRVQFICSLLSAWLAFDLLNRDENWIRKRGISSLESPNKHHLPPPSYRPQYAGKTIDFTSFAFCRALDIVIISAWTRTRSKPWHPEQQSPGLANAIRKLADPTIFAASAAIIMWSWFYAPDRLPREYNQWISKVADIDSRLIEALRLARRGEFVYGEDTGKAQLLKPLCQELGLPEEYADPTKTIPIPWTGKSCEMHAASRFWRSWKFAMEIYIPLQLLARIRSPNMKSALEGIKAATRSSSFLAAYTALVYYGICLARTRLGPKVFSRKTVTPQMWDSGLCVLAGCLACGWSILLEKPSRRQEVAFFVAPRALATLLPRVYDRQYRIREQAVFATSVALVLTTLKAGNERNVRGVLGRVLGSIMRE